MEIDLLNHLRGLDSLAIIGMAKHAGKTTTLNRLLVEWPYGPEPERVVAMTSIGLDGELRDTVSGRDATRIYAPRGVIIVTAQESVRRCDATMEIVSVLDFQTAMGKLVMARALSDGYIELAGPARASDIKAIEDAVREVEPDAFFVVDGALSRISTAGHGFTAGAILCVGSVYGGNPDKPAEAVAQAAKMLSLPQAEPLLCEVVSKVSEEVRLMLCLPQLERKEACEESDPADVTGYEVLPLEGRALGSADQLLTALRNNSPKEGGLPPTPVLRGVITDRYIKELLKDECFKDLTLVVEDGTRIFLDRITIRRLEQKKIKIRVLTTVDLRLISANPTDANGTLYSSEDMVAAIKRALPEKSKIPVHDYGQAEF